MTHDLPDEHGRNDRFEYFMLRLTRSELEPDRVAGLIQQLGSGEKRSFNTAEQLVELIAGQFRPLRHR